MKIKKTPGGIWTAVIKTKFGDRSITLHGAKDEAEAKALAKLVKIADVEKAAAVAKIQTDLLAQVMSGCKVRIRDAILQWEDSLRSDGNTSERTIYNNITFVRAWAATVFGRASLPSAVEPKHIADWVNAPDAGKLGTRKVKLSIMRGFFDFCSARGWCVGNPAREVRKVNMSVLSHAEKEVTQKTPFKEREIDTILFTLESTLSDLQANKVKLISGGGGITIQKKYDQFVKRMDNLHFWKAAIIIGRDTGLRIGDVCQLEWACFDKEMDKVVVWTDKRDKRVELPVTEAMKNVIKAVATDRTTEKFLFPAQRNIIKSPKRSQLSVQFIRIMKSSGVEGHTFHDLRYFYAQEALREGRPIEHIQEDLGHGSKEMTEHYAKTKKPKGEIIRYEPEKEKAATEVSDDILDAALP